MCMYIFLCSITVLTYDFELTFFETLYYFMVSYIVSKIFTRVKAAKKLSYIYIYIYSLVCPYTSIIWMYITVTHAIPTYIEVSPYTSIISVYICVTPRYTYVYRGVSVYRYISTYLCGFLTRNPRRNQSNNPPGFLK